MMSMRGVGGVKISIGQTRRRAVEKKLQPTHTRCEVMDGGGDVR